MMGPKLKQYRIERKLSVSELARRAGVSKSLISQIENGESNPSVETIRAVALALEVPVFSLFIEDDGEHSALVRKDERVKLIVPDSKAERELLTKDGQGANVALISRIPPGANSSPHPTSHIGEEWILILQGELVVEIQDKTVQLNAGDFFYFDARMPHLFLNKSEADVEFLCTISPAHFPPVG
jgi:transcriptional regulator with XRE-family HTH domain